VGVEGRKEHIRARPLVASLSWPTLCKWSQPVLGGYVWRQIPSIIWLCVLRFWFFRKAAHSGSRNIPQAPPRILYKVRSKLVTINNQDLLLTKDLNLQNFITIKPNYSDNYLKSSINTHSLCFPTHCCKYLRVSLRNSVIKIQATSKELPLGNISGKTSY
jgi:hypothetical protein